MQRKAKKSKEKQRKTKKGKEKQRKTTDKEKQRKTKKEKGLYIYKISILGLKN